MYTKYGYREVCMQRNIKHRCALLTFIVVIVISDHFLCDGKWKITNV